METLEHVREQLVNIASGQCTYHKSQYTTMYTRLPSITYLMHPLPYLAVAHSLILMHMQPVICKQYVGYTQLLVLIDIGRCNVEVNACQQYQRQRPSVYVLCHATRSGMPGDWGVVSRLICCLDDCDNIRISRQAITCNRLSEAAIRQAISALLVIIHTCTAYMHLFLYM